MQRKRRIAVVVELNWPYKRHYGLFAGIQKYALDHANWSLDLEDYPELQLAEGKRFDGIIGRITEYCFSAAQDAGIPALNVWRGSPVATQMPSVYVDYFSAGRMAAEHLIARGLKRLAHFGYLRDPASKQHSEGMREVAREYGYSFKRYLASTRFSDNREQWLRFTAFVRQSQVEWEAPLGIGFMEDKLCRSVASTCLNMGWTVPEQLALVSSGNNELICDSIDPTLSSIEMGYQQCGYEAARQLDRLMRGRTVAVKAQLTPPKELVVRRSSDAFAVSDPKVAQALRHMSDHVGDVHSVPSIAQSVGLRRQSLERRFRRHVGRSVNDELIRLRVERLQRLLVESDKPISSLSTEAGFGTTVNMYTMFKRHAGMTPAAYRTKHAARPGRDELQT